MTYEEAAQLIEVISKSIRDNPSQFQFEVNVSSIGTIAMGMDGGKGIDVKATGGGPGSTTIGYQSISGGPNVQIAQKAANEAVVQQMSALVQNLNNLASEFRSAKPDKGRIKRILDSLTERWVPNVIVAIVANIIAKLSVG